MTICNSYNIYTVVPVIYVTTVWHKILMGEIYTRFDEDLYHQKLFPWLYVAVTHQHTVYSQTFAVFVVFCSTSNVLRRIG